MADCIIRREYGCLNPRTDLSAEEARAVLSYDKETGELRWAVARKHIKVGQIATRRGGKNSRALTLAYHGVNYIAARVIWLIMTGDWPKYYIDHIDNDPKNNCWSNLREASYSQNAINHDYRTRSPYRGVRLVDWGKSSKTRWRARISIAPGKRIELGCFESAEEAYEAYQKAAIKYHGEFARLIVSRRRMDSK